MLMKSSLLISLTLVLSLSFHLSFAQTNVYALSCSWIISESSMGQNGLTENNFSFYSPPDGYFIIYLDATHNILLMEGEIASGKKQGEWKYYLNGNINEKINYYDDERSGIYEAYYSNGLPKIKANFVNGLANGEYIVYDSSGNINLQLIMLNGTPLVD